ncbi:MAG: precorrin-2 C(20)-methyltransferase [Cyanobacteria bacterium P01_A01_bin.105]
MGRWHFDDTTVTTTQPSSRGILTGVGIGPGDPDLITVKALKQLQASPVVAFPAGRQGQPGVAERIIAPWLRSHQLQLPLWFPYVFDPATLSAAWQTAAQQVWQYLQAGQDVTFASEGDVSFYSTFSYLAQALIQQYPTAQVRAIPGVCSPLAAAAVMGQPLTQQHQRLAILPAVYAISELETALDWAEVVVLMKLGSVYAEVWQVLAQRQLLQQSYVVQSATTADQIVYAGLGDLPTLSLPYFSILVTQVKPLDLVF